MLVGTADTVVGDGELSRAAGRLSSKGMGDLSDHAIPAQLRDKHPSRAHPIPNAAYEIPVDEAASTVDMLVPYQQLKQNVTAGPSGMRDEYLGCLLFASARLVAPVKKLGKGGRPVRPMAVGETAERRAAERAVIDNIKKASVVRVPSFIAHTDLRNAYNEAWRRTIIQRHIDCSPLRHPIIPPSLSMDSFMLVDDRSAPVRSAEDGVHFGAPLATTSFCVAIHPEVEECDKTLEGTDGAARFNADDRYVADVQEHFWPALHVFCTSIRHPWGLSTTHGILVLNVPLGLPGYAYVHAHMRGKAEELQAEVEAFAEAVDATVLTAVERVLGVSFDPSTYGTDTNPVVIDSMAELLHDPDTTAAKAATLSENAVARARSRLRLRSTRLKGGGISRKANARDAAVIGCMNAILPRFLTRTNSETNTTAPPLFL
eukprot:jgi/Tetstr1/436879/TSEL_025655.t1